MASEPRTMPLRADAERNRRRLIDAAAELINERGIEASISDIRERAGVGQGTVFRHFATKEHLMAEVMRERMELLIGMAEERTDADDPAAALRDFLFAAAEGKSVNQAIYRAICETDALPAAEERALRGRLVAAIGQLLRRAQADGTIRADVTPEDVLLLETAAVSAGSALGAITPDLWRRYMDLIFDGLRPAGAHPLSHPAPTPDQLDQLTAGDGPAR